jgi:hypothetical protein
VAIKIDAMRSLRIGGALGPTGPRTRILRLG